MSFRNLETDSIYAALKLDGTDGNVLAGLSKHLEHVQKIVTAHQEKVGRINASPDFTAEGKRRQIVEINESTSEDLERVRAAASGYDDHIEQLQQQLTPKVREGDAILQHLQERELRDRLYDLDNITLQEMYQTASNDGGDDALMFAVENAPKAFPLLPQEVLEEGMRRRAERQSPQTAAKLSELLKVRNALDDAIAAARAGLSLQENDPLTRIANAEV